MTTVLGRGVAPCQDDPCLSWAKFDCICVAVSGRGHLKIASFIQCAKWYKRLQKKITLLVMIYAPWSSQQRRWSCWVYAHTALFLHCGQRWPVGRDFPLAAFKGLEHVCQGSASSWRFGVTWVGVVGEHWQELVVQSFRFGDGITDKSVIDLEW